MFVGIETLALALRSNSSIRPDLQNAEDQMHGCVLSARVIRIGRVVGPRFVAHLARTVIGRLVLEIHLVQNDRPIRRDQIRCPPGPPTASLEIAATTRFALEAVAPLRGRAGVVALRPETKHARSIERLLRRLATDAIVIIHVVAVFVLLKQKGAAARLGVAVVEPIRRAKKIEALRLSGGRCSGSSVDRSFRLRPRNGPREQTSGKRAKRRDFIAAWIKE
mmetsp:Transcript_35138/g.108881  ORF Transcript_35138/g.108881 Transcript_35138/m.108881 type:complete len:221 (+) Transcript_35138:464-1126(+)